jgi:hypothetical protein
MTLAAPLCRPRCGAAAGPRLSWPFGHIPFQTTDLPSTILEGSWAVHPHRRSRPPGPLFDALPGHFLHSLEPAA